jgi:nucleolar protein 53
MGKKVQGSAKRAKKRAQEASEELTEAVAHNVETSHVVLKKNEELFELDNASSTVPGGLPRNSATAGALNQPYKRRRKGMISISEQKQVEDLVKAHDAVTLSKMAHDTKHAVDLARRKKQIENCPTYDLWDLTPPLMPAKETVTPDPQDRKLSGIGASLAGTAPPHVSVLNRTALPPPHKQAIAIRVAHGGQSYHPDPEQHQDVIGEALALEIRRKEVQTYLSKPISSGLSETTKALLLGSDDEHEESDAEDKLESDSVKVVITKRKTKLTQAERNRQKRHRIWTKEQDERKKAKQLIHSVNESKRIARELAKKEREHQDLREIRKRQREESVPIPGKDVWQALSRRDPLGVPALPVALTHEIQQSSLRTIRPKGSLLEDRLFSYRDRNMATPRSVGDKKRIVQGRKRIKVRGAANHKFLAPDGTELHLMG